ncbi:MAG TPA: prolipoprotein diacylglyceryl transferase family protein [Pirellulales bacterium]|jgi:phosphatidylglycerol:prolipoprotein diacylglycerol transferase|nr:prolipoprotein diacylglyceryl transferase family protein [Pirellulales bacterium]
MLQTLFYIPDRVFGMPLFGWGLLLAVWAVASAATLSYQVWRHGFGQQAASYLPLLALIGLAIRFLLPALEQVEHLPTGENIVLGLPIRGYGVMLLIGLVSAVGLGVYRARQRGIDPEIMYSLAIWLFIGGFGGARLFYVTEYWTQQFVKHHADGSFDFGATLAAVANVAQGGIVVYGGLAGGVLAGAFFLRRHRLPVLRIFDICAPSVMLGLAIGRIGCFLNGCCYGGVCALPWAVAFPQQSPPFERQMNRAQLYLHGLAFSDQGTGLGGPAIIYHVEPGSAAARAGLKADQQIVEIDRQTASDPKPVRIFPAKRREGAGEGAVVQDDSLSAAEMALLGVSGEGTRITLRTDRSAEPASWAITAADEPPQRSLPVHPTQLYDSLGAALLCLLLIAYGPFSRHDGETLALLFILHPVARFLIEAIRTDEPKKYFGMSISQVGSLLFVAIAMGLWFYLRRRPAKSAGPRLAAPIAVG